MLRASATVLTVAIVLTGAASAGAAELPERILKAGKIVIATEGKFPPMNYFDAKTNQLVGFDIDLGNEIGKELGIKVEWQDAPFPQLLPSLRTGRVDAVIAGIRDTVARREIADFVDYLMAGAQFLTLKKLADRFPNATDFCGRKVGANVAANWTRWINEWSQKNCVQAGRPPIEVLGAENTLAARVELKTGRVDAAVAGSETTAFVEQIEPGIFSPVGVPFAQSPTGIATPKTPDGEKTRDAIAAALQRVHSSGAYDRLLAKYGLEANAYKPVTINAGTEP